MKARLIAPDAPEWQAVLAGTVHDVYHQPWYVSAAAAAEGGRPAAVHVDDGDERRLLLPIVLRAIEGGRTDAASPYGYPGPIVAGAPSEAFVAEAMREAKACLAEHGIVSLFIRLNPLIATPGIEHAGTVVEHGLTVVVDLTESAEEQWRHTRANHRRDINRSLRAGHAFAIENTSESFSGFRTLYEATMRRLSASDYYLFDDAYFASLRDALGTHLHLATVRIDDALGAAALFSTSCGIIQLHLAGWDEGLAHHRPTKRLYHEAIRWGHERGDHWFNLGGGFASSEDSLLHFKLGFSHDTRRFRTLRSVIDEREYQRLVARGDGGARVTSLDGFFPAYRTPQIAGA